MADVPALETFVAVARAGSVVGAAERLARTQPSISARLLALEAAWATKLFRRHARGMALTPEGARLLPLAEQLEVTVLIAPLVGEHVVAGRPIAYAWRTSLEQPPPDPAALAGPIQDAVVIGYQRTLQQDVRFGMRQLVDIALRAFPCG